MEGRGSFFLSDLIATPVFVITKNKKDRMKKGHICGE
jgi:hypothetical protein